MNHTLVSFDYALWLISLGLQFGILATILHRGILKNLYLFHVSIAYSLVRSSFLLFQVSHLSQQDYAVLYWRLASFTLLLQGLLVAQIAGICLKAPANRVIYSFAGTAALMSALSLWFARGLASTASLMSLSLLATVAVIAVLATAITVREIEKPYGPVAWGLLLGAVVQGVVSFYRVEHTWEHWEVLRRVVPVTSTAVLIYWFWSFIIYKSGGLAEMARHPVRSG